MQHRWDSFTLHSLFTHQISMVSWSQNIAPDIFILASNNLLTNAFALLRFLHLITHALFKSCIFIAVGGLIGSTFSLQDSRGYCRAGVNSLTSHCVLGVCVFSLCGLLFTAGFMSKDLIIASMIRMQSAHGMIILFGFRILFTLWYSARMMQAVACVSSSSISCNGMNKIMLVSLLPVAVGGVVGGLLLVQRCIFMGNQMKKPQQCKCKS